MTENIKRHTIGVISENIQDFKEWILEKNLIGNYVNSPRQFKTIDTVYLCFSDYCSIRGYTVDELIETENAKNNKKYFLIFEQTKFCLKP